MSDLLGKACSYFQAAGYRVARQEADFAELHPGPETQGQSILMVWASDALLAKSDNLSREEEAEREERERGLLDRFTAVMGSAAKGTLGYYLVRNRTGLSRDFITKATGLLSSKGDGGIRSPVQFFDTPYKIEEGGKARKARSMIAQVMQLAVRQRRAAQPFYLRTGLGPSDRKPGDGDLVEYLDQLLRDPSERPMLHLIDGPAGGGKSVAYNALVKGTYDEFIAAKNQGVLRRRPIVFLPEHIRGVEIGYVDDIIDAVVDAEVAEVVEPEQFHWLLHNGHTLWMFDGLDEIYAGENDFFSFIDRMLSAPDSRAQILICTRDSLTSSSARMRRFIEGQLQAGHAVAMYELAPWGPDAWRDIAWLELENGREGGRSSPRVGAFVTALEASKELSALASLPFYCSLLLELYRAKGRMPSDRLELLDFVVERMMDREHGKGVFRWRDFIAEDLVADALAAEAEAQGIRLIDGLDARQAIASVLDAEGRRNLLEILGAIAHQRCRTVGGEEAGALDAETIRGFLGASYASETSADGSDRALLALVQFAFFGAGRQGGLVDFTHPILAEYLAGTYAVAMLETQAEARSEGRSSAALALGTLRQALGNKELVAGSVFADVVRRAIAENPSLKSFVGELADSGDARLTADAGLLLRR